jgi:hypothetical protein
MALSALAPAGTSEHAVAAGERGARIQPLGARSSLSRLLLSGEHFGGDGEAFSEQLRATAQRASMISFMSFSR